MYDDQRAYDEMHSSSSLELYLEKRANADCSSMTSLTLVLAGVKDSLTVVQATIFHLTGKSASSFPFLVDGLLVKVLYNAWSE